MDGTGILHILDALGKTLATLEAQNNALRERLAELESALAQTEPEDSAAV